MMKKMMKIGEFKEVFFYLFAVCTSIFLLFFFIGNVWIGHEAKRLCQEARWEYQKTNCVKALIMMLDDENQGYRTRNHAIWALGQFGDKRALLVLQKYYTGNIPKKEPLDLSISQYELKKAIKLANGGLNITAWVWRWGME